MFNIEEWLLKEFCLWNKKKRDYKKWGDKGMWDWCEGRAVQALKTLRKIRGEEMK